ncbi:MAG: YlqD family protein [bacterium]
MLVKRSITLKALATPEFRKEMLQDLQTTMQRLELELQQIEFQGKRMLLEAEKQGLQQVTSTKQQIEQEKEKRLEMRERLRQKMAEVRSWVEGQEVVQGAVEGWVKVKPGDDIARILGAEIVIENGKIVELRHE